MDPNFGSGNALLGGGNEALKAVMQQQGIDTGILDQQTPASAGFNPALQPSVQGAPQGAPAPAPQTPMPMEGGMPMGSSEASLIIQVLGDRLKSMSKQEEQVLKPPAPPTPPAPEPTPQPQVPQF